jgi:hypothetical protein
MSTCARGSAAVDPSYGPGCVTTTESRPQQSQNPSTGRETGQALRLLPAPGIVVSRHTALRILLKIPLPEATTPRVLGIDFALRRGLVYATVLIDAETGRRVDVPPGRTANAAGRQESGHGV